MELSQVAHCDKCHGTLASDDCGIDWDNRRLCRDCFTAEFHAEFGDLALHPREAVHVGFLEALVRGVRSALIVNTLFALGLFSLFLLLRFAFQFTEMAAGKPFAAPDLKVWSCFLGFSWCFVGIITFPMALGYSLTSRSRSIFVADRQLVQKTTFGSLKIPFEKCIWYNCPKGTEGARMLLWGRALVGVTERQDGRTSLVCGFTDQTRRLWTGYFGYALQPREPGFPTGPVLFAGLFGLIVGGTVGALVGGVLNLATRDPRWLSALIFLGFIDGSLWSLVVAIVKAARDLNVKSKVHWNETVIAIGTITGAAHLGAFAGMLAGFQGAIASGAANALLALIGWLWILPRLRQLRNVQRSEA